MSEFTSNAVMVAVHADPSTQLVGATISKLSTALAALKVNSHSALSVVAAEVKINLQPGLGQLDSAVRANVAVPDLVAMLLLYTVLPEQDPPSLTNDHEFVETAVNVVGTDVVSVSLVAGSCITIPTENGTPAVSGDVGHVTAATA
jgi:ABC-type arginine transport system permease subunit